MDDYERMARSIGAGHVLLRGVAGSGKTMTLCARARHLRQRHPDWRMLVLCFNISLAYRLRQLLSPGAAAEIATFHDWAQSRIEASGLPIPAPPGRGTQWDHYWTHDMARLLLRAFDEALIPAGEYQAILVDEGQDFAPDWYRALGHALDPGVDHLVVSFDPAQNIYRRELPWAEVGLEPEDHSFRLDGNRRNTPAIARAARRLLDPIDGPVGGEAEAAGVARSDGPLPEVRRCATFGDSREHALGWVRACLARGTPARGILVLGLGRLDMITVNAWLNSKGVGAWLPAEAPDGAGVRVSTIHGAKGLEADAVLLLDAHHLQTREDGEARRLLYIAMTRARRDLGVSYFRDTPLMAELERACAG